jgi:hypothetical protein
MAGNEDSEKKGKFYRMLLISELLVADTQLRHLGSNPRLIGYGYLWHRKQK